MPIEGAGNSGKNAYSRKDHGGHLTSSSFQGLLWTQWLGATNDNILRWIVIGIGKEYVETSDIAAVLTGGTACFVLPYLLLAAPAGYLADCFNKRSVIVLCKAAEILIMLVAALAILVVFLTAGSALWFLFVVVFLMGSQSALFGPSKLGSIPEMLPAEKISAANGLMGLTTVMATVLGMAIGNLLADLVTGEAPARYWVPGLVLVSVAVIGWLSSLAIRGQPAANPGRRFPWDAAQQTWRDLRRLASSRPLLRVALGIMFFWALGAMAQLNIDQFAAEAGTTTQRQVTPLLLALVTGVGIGSVLAGVWSAGRVELGILPLGAGGIAISSILLFSVQGSIVNVQSEWTAEFVWACLFLFFLGTSAGLFDVPLAAYMQHRSPTASRGAILAASNFLTFTGILVAALAFAWLKTTFDSRHIFLLCGLFTLPVFGYIVCLIPQASMRFFVWLASKTIYQIRVYGRENLPEQGGALIIPNHVSWLDGVVLLMISARPVRMVVYAENFQHCLLRWLGNLWQVIPFPTRPKALVRTLNKTRQALTDGELVCIFPEGGISRSGQLQAFKPGVLKIHQGTGVPIIPVYLDELWGSIFSFERGKFFWKWPRKWRYPVSIHIGRPIGNPDDIHAIRQAVQELGATAVKKRSERMVMLPRAFIRKCKAQKFTTKVSDSGGTRLTGGALLMRTLILRRLLLRHVLEPDEQFVGVLVPPSVGAVVTNAALAISRRIAVNLNYTISSEAMNQCIDQCGIRHVLTSRRFMEKMEFDINAPLVYLEDFRDQVTRSDQLSSAFAAFLAPSGLLERCLDLHAIRSDDVLTVIFTSGSTGRPKGVMLTQANVGSNIEAIQQVIHLSSDDVVIGILPFFHAFGYTATLWGTLSINSSAAFHVNPLDARQVGKLCRKSHGTVLLGTPTFLRSYLRRCSAEDFSTLKVAVAGAEKMPADLCDAFEDKFGVRPVEGYGATELSPLVSVNVPLTRSHSDTKPDWKEGTVGKPVPGVSARVVDLDSGETLGANQSGMLWIRGPNVMKGYLNQPDLTAEVIKDGWYVTGDVAQIDDDGFITITGRQSRFSKIGGEMVPHIRIEESLTQIIRDDDEGLLKAAVTAVPDDRKGERLVVIHTELEQSPQQLCDALSAEGLPNIYIPSPDSFHQVAELPILGSGKLDLKGIRKIAMERFGPEA